MKGSEELEAGRNRIPRGRDKADPHEGPSVQHGGRTSPYFSLLSEQVFDFIDELKEFLPTACTGQAPADAGARSP